MLSNGNNRVNAGVHTNVGMDFQKNCTVYLFLEKYESLKDSNYFIVLEHHEDVLFCHLNDRDQLENVETYQAKKSGTKWTIKADLIEVLKKISSTAQAVLDDSHEKSEDFSQENYFVTNHRIELKRTLDKQKYSKVVNEVSNSLLYTSLDKELKEKIEDGTDKISFTDEDKEHLENLTFRYVDLGKTTKSQLNQLTGMFESTFGNQITDYRAALTTFLAYLHGIESTFNQGNIATLTDKTKRLESSQIEEVIQLLTTKKMAYDFWRDKGRAICIALQITLLDESAFKLHYLNSFDNFKDLSESEHLKIYNFVDGNRQIFGNHFDETDCILDFLNSFNYSSTTTFLDIQLKAVISAAYVSIKSLL